MKRGAFRNSYFSLMLIFVVSTSLIFLMMAMAYKQLSSLSENTNWVYHSQSVSLKLEQLYSNLKDIETERLDYVLSPEFSDAPANIIRKIDHNEQALDILKKLLVDNPKQYQRMMELETLVAKKYFIVQRTFIEQASAGEDTRTMTRSLLAGKKIMAEISEKINIMLAEEDRLFRERRTNFIFSERWTPIYLYAIALFSLGSLGFAFFRISKDLKIQKQTNKSLNLSLNINDFAQDIAKFGTWTYNADTKQIQFSENLRRVMGLSGRNLNNELSEALQRIDPQQQEIFKENWLKWQDGQGTEPFEIQYTDPAGNIKYLRNLSKNITSLTGEDSLLGVTADITEEVRNKASLATANRELTWYNTTSKEAEKIGKFGFMRWTPSTGEIIVSDNLFYMYGLAKTGPEKAFERFRTRIDAADQVTFAEKIHQAKDHQENIAPFMLKIRIPTEHQPRYIRVSNKFFSSEGDAPYYLVICQDITDEVAAQQEMEAKNRTLEANNQELQAFNYVASHDLQEPLRKIETFISRLMISDGDQLSEQGKNYLAKTQSSAGRMRKLIDDLLQFSRSTRSRTAFERTDLNVLLEESKEELTTQIEEKSALITSDRLPVILAIPFQIKQLFVNLLSNSVKYSKDGIAPEINISYQLVDSNKDASITGRTPNLYHRITFSDNGIGFDNEYREKIFQLFTRLDPGQDHEGTGIGLAICKKIAENHRGFLNAKGKLDMGASFRLYLPVG